MKVAIVDDEQHCIDHLSTLLKPFGAGMDISCFGSAEDAIAGLDTLRPDIVFLDVQLHDKTGFDVLSSISKRDFSLIFTTAYEAYAIEAFKFSAIDYLLKPVDKDDFEMALQKATDKVEQSQLHDRVKVLLSHISTHNSPKRISVPSNDGYVFLLMEDIVRCQADVNYTHIFTVDGKKYTASKTLKHFEKLLERQHFFRIHNSHLINLTYVNSYHKDGYAILKDGLKLEVSTRRKEAFIKECGRF
ncbi:LytR/AlgR family response regulator transcription factor [Allomuricauda sp. M10]|uniref:LytR/AlgR family response regulator transcription factor n=1 Tax=Allomuricauda sp. M10 TaxID=2683292 RepID=UPI001D1953D7|nr:LytTR family DNA-binding domain-containing protein [Muricauda sp. M10]